MKRAENNLSCRLHTERGWVEGRGLALISISPCTPRSIMSLPLITVASLLVIGCGGAALVFGRLDNSASYWERGRR